MEKKMTVGELKEILEDFDSEDEVVIEEFLPNFPYTCVYRMIKNVKENSGICVLEKGDFY